MYCRKVRQESQLWTDLHQGLLTTGKLNAALGFYEPAAAKRLGIPRDRVNHNSLLSAAANLSQPSYGLELLNVPAAPTQTGTTTAVARPPGLENAITVSEYEAAAIKLANASAAGSAISKSKRARMRRQRQRYDQQQQQQQAAVPSRTATVTVGKAYEAGQGEASSDPYGSDDAKRNRCLTVAARGTCNQKVCRV